MPHDKEDPASDREFCEKAFWKQLNKLIVK